jgi:hypothetical protein
MCFGIAHIFWGKPLKGRGRLVYTCDRGTPRVGGRGAPRRSSEVKERAAVYFVSESAAM